MLNTMRSIALAVAVTAALMAGAAWAGSVVVNDVEMDDIDLKQLAGQKFTNCTVEVDRNGKLHVTIPGVKFQKVTPDQAKALEKEAMAQPPAQAYYIATDLSSSLDTGFQVNVYVNEKLAKMVLPGDPRLILDVSTYLHAGSNTVRFVAHKEEKGSGKSSDKFSITFGQGHWDGGIFKMDEPMAMFEVSASQTKDIEKSFTVEVK